MNLHPRKEDALRFPIAFCFALWASIAACVRDPNPRRDVAPAQPSTPDRPPPVPRLDYHETWQTCTIVGGPPEQMRAGADLGMCRPDNNRREIDHDITGWFQVVADTPGSTAEIVSATLYGVRMDGSLQPVAGTGAGQATVIWAGFYSRDPWFGNDNHVSVPGQTRLTIPTGNTLLHGGVGHASFDGFIDAIFVVEARTTGDAKVQIGIDLRPAETETLPNDAGIIPHRSVNQYALSDWFTSTTGCARSTPRRHAPTDCSAPH